MCHPEAQLPPLDNGTRRAKPLSKRRCGYRASLHVGMLADIPPHRNACRFETDPRRGFRREWVSGQAWSSYVERNLFVSELRMAQMLLFRYLVLLLTYRARILQIFGRCNSFPHFSKLRNLDAEQKYK